jgi:hypothetical protein
MRSLRRFFEWYLGLDPSAVGEGTAWSFVVGNEAGSPLTQSLLLGLGIIAGAAAISVYWLDARHLSPRRGLVLLALRLAAGTLLLLLLGHVSVRVDRTALPPVAVLIDVSASMGLHDQYLESAARDFIADLPGEASDTGPGRLDLVRQLLTRDDGEWLQRMEATHQVEVALFDEHLRPLPIEDDLATASSNRVRQEALENLAFGGNSTSPAKAVRELLDSRRGVAWSAIILLTDGVTTTGDDDDLAAAAHLARDRGVPLYIVGVGSGQPVRDVELLDVLGPEVAFVGDPISCSLRIRQSGFAGSEARVQVTLAGGGEPLASRTIRLGSDGESTIEDLTFVAQREGELEVAVDVLPVVGEAETGNNRRVQRLVVRGDRLRVLLVEERPRWEYRSLKPLLERDDSLDLRTFLVESDLNFATEDRTALGSLPVDDAALAGFDVVILGDVDLAAIDPRFPGRLRTFVSETGGGLILIAGLRQNPASYAGTPLEALLPVTMTGESSQPEGAVAVAGFRIDRTVEGRVSSFLRLDDDPERDDALWRTLPAELTWSASNLTAKPGAQTLATRRDANGPSEEIPIILQQRYGKGRVLFHATDELWRWRRRVEDLRYGRYWGQAVRAMARQRSSEEMSGISLNADRRLYEMGDEVRLRLRLRLSADQSLDDPAQGFKAHWESDQGTQGAATLLPLAGSADRFEARLSDLPIGEYRVWLADSDRESAGIEARFAVMPPDRESRSRPAATDEMDEAAELSHGKSVMIWNAGRLPAELPRKRPVRVSRSQPIPLWNRWESLVALASLLTAEWLLRRRSQLV